jgi:hypothetical protein
MLIKSVASGALAEVADVLAVEMIGNGWVAAHREPAAKKGAPVADVADPADVAVTVPDPTAAPKKAPAKKATTR